MEDSSGKYKQAFQLLMDVSWFQKGDTLDSGKGKLLIQRAQSKLQLLTIPKRFNFKWYHRLINWITFGYLCPTGFYYKVKLVE